MAEERRAEILRYSGTFCMNRDEQVLAAAEDARIELDDEHLVLGGGFGNAQVISYRNISRIRSEDYRVCVELLTGESLVFSHLGRHFRGFSRDLNTRRNDLIVRDYLMYEGIVEDGIPAEYRAREDGRTLEGKGAVRLYETALVLVTDGEGVVRIPFGLVSDVSEGDYSLRVEAEYGTTIELSGMGRAHGYFAARLSEALDALAARTARELDAMLPTVGPVRIHNLTRLLRDGRAARRAELEAIHPGTWNAFRARMEDLGCREYYDYLRSLADTEDAYLGTKRGLLGDDRTGHYIWFLVPMLGAAPGAGNALAMEVAGEEGGRATYFFRLVSRDIYPDIGRAELEGEAERAARHLSRCMLTINFRREPIYLPTPRLSEPRYVHYAAAVAAMPCLQELRDRFIGRVIHRTPEGWQRDVLDLLTFNTSTRDDSARWRGDPAPEEEWE